MASKKLTKELLREMRDAGICHVDLAVGSNAEVDAVFADVVALSDEPATYTHQPYDAVGETGEWRQACAIVNGVWVTIGSPHVRSAA
jgi:hypothetical protein